MTSATPTSDRRSVFFAAAVVALAALAAYGGTFAVPFIFDDNGSIPLNPTIRHLWPIGPVLWGAPKAATVGGRPLLNLSFALNYAYGGLSVGSYHAVNLLIHIGAGLALFGIVRRTLSRTLFAFAVALIWTLHPLQTEAVTYVVQRAESLMGLFYLLTLYCFVRGALLCPPDAGSAAAVEPNLWFGLSWLACLLGMATKEVMVTVPVMVLLYDRTFAAGSFRAAWAKRKGYYLGLAATWALLGVLVVGMGGNRGGTSGLVAGIPWWAYWMTQFRAICQYLRLALWPHPLVLEYGAFWEHRVLAVAPFAVVVGALAVGTLIALRRRPKLGFLGFWFFGILAVTSLVPGTIQMIAEHRMYLPLAAIVVLGVRGLEAMAAGLAGRRSSAAGGVFLVLVLAIAAAFGAATWKRNRTYRSEISIWQDTVDKRPGNALAHSYLAYALFKQNRYTEALAHCEAMVQLRPEVAAAHNNLGAAYFHLGRLPEAEREFRIALKLQPDFPEARRNFGDLLFALGRISFQEGHFPEAVAQYQAALRLGLDDADIRNNLAAALQMQGRLPEAIAQYEAALRLAPNDPDICANLAAARRAAAESRR